MVKESKFTSNFTASSTKINSHCMENLVTRVEPSFQDHTIRTGDYVKEPTSGLTARCLLVNSIGRGNAVQVLSPGPMVPSFSESSMKINH